MANQKQSPIAPKNQKNAPVPEQRQTAHQQYIRQVDPNDLQAQVFVRNMQQRERELKQQRIAEMGGIAADPHAVEQQRAMMEIQRYEAQQPHLI